MSENNTGGNESGVSLDDVQGEHDQRQIAIDKVGIKDILHPVKVAKRAGGSQHTVANFNMYVGLPHNFKGTHMSRFVEVLNDHEFEITVGSFQQMTREMVEKLDAENGHIEMSFPYFVEKSAPVSGVKGLLDYQATLIGEIKNGVESQFLRLLVPVTTLCPCSKKISERGAHNQRGHVTVTVKASQFIWMEELIELVEGQASCDLYGVLKRPDEKYVTERAYDNPKFVEDLVRDVASLLAADSRVEGYSVEVENFESIHNHSAYAYVERF
ncbi:MAG: GTP cyclohydrolase I [Planctomycetota bacterium]|jgi:GTP cyclohydrolase I